jgi:hypothetical protein
VLEYFRFLDGREPVQLTSIFLVTEASVRVFRERRQVTEVNVGGGALVGPRNTLRADRASLSSCGIFQMLGARTVGLQSIWKYTSVVN